RFLLVCSRADNFFLRAATRSANSDSVELCLVGERSINGIGVDSGGTKKDACSLVFCNTSVSPPLLVLSDLAPVSAFGGDGESRTILADVSFSGCTGGPVDASSVVRLRL
nr:hypothetical protein [Tanacetum cinerariifolium]